jgi:hypothetical protein
VKLRLPTLGRKSLSALLVLTVIFAGAVYKAYTEPPRGPIGEVVPPDEEVYTSRIIDSGISMLTGVRTRVGDGLYRRDAHAKTHACLLGNFTVNKGLDQDVGQGLFAESKTYKAWVRFSSGNEDLRSDWKPDARGMAIKVLGVPGQKILEGEENARTQDFLMINNPAFFIPNVAEYAAFTSAQAGGSQFGYFFAPKWNPLQWKLRQFRIGVDILKWPPRNLLGTQFHSMTAYKLGATHYVKHSTKPVACDGTSKVSSSWASFGSASLRADLESWIKDKSACFDFMVQLQKSDKNMPVEDPTIQWKESDSPFIVVARLELPKQDIAPALVNNFCENLSFTPWHTLPAHEPIGGLNRVRKAVYQGISRYRRCLNGIAFGEPEEDGSTQFEMKACNPNEPVPPIPSSASTRAGPV